jgi:hypothetical protein
LRSSSQPPRRRSRPAACLLFEQLRHLVFAERLGELVADLVEAFDEP